MPSSDPIQQFSSPDPIPKPSACPPHPRVRPLQVTEVPLEPDKFVSNGLLGTAPTSSINLNLDLDDDDDEEELPDVATLLAEDGQKRSAAKRAQDLAQLKQRALKQQALHQVEDDGSDIEIVDSPSTRQSRQAGKQKHVYVRPTLSKTSKGLPYPTGRHKLDEISSSQVLAEAAVPHFANSSKADKGKGNEIDQRSLNRILAQRMVSQGQESIRQKEAEWTKRGGRITEMPEQGDRRLKMQDRILALSEKALSRETNATPSYMEDEDAEGSDQEWLPDTVPDVEEGVALENDAEDEEEPGFVVHQSSDHPSCEEPTDEEDVNPRPRHGRTRHTAVLDSDDENTAPNSRYGRVLVPDTSSFIQGSSSSPRMNKLETASVDGTVENETDKENDASMVFDRGEDKENTVIRAPVFGGRNDGPLRRNGSFALGLQLAREPSLSDEGLELGGPSSSQGKREPFKEISGDMDDPFMSEPVDIPVAPLQVSPRPPHLSSPSLSPLQFQKGLDDDFGAFGGLSEDIPMSDAQNENNPMLSLEPAATISPGFSRLFESSAATKVVQSPMVQNALKAGGFSQFFTPDKVSTAQQDFEVVSDRSCIGSSGSQCSEEDPCYSPDLRWWDWAVIGSFGDLTPESGRHI